MLLLFTDHNDYMKYFTPKKVRISAGRCLQSS